MFANLFKQTRRRGLQARQPLLRTCVRHITPSGELRGDDAMKALKRSRREAFELLKSFESGETKKKKKKKKGKGQSRGNLTMFDSVPTGRAKDMWMLEDEDLDDLDPDIRENPKSPHFAPMKLYSVIDLLPVAMTKYGGSSGFLSSALAAKRKGVQASPLKALPTSEQSAPCPLYELPGKVAEEAVGVMREKYHFLLTFTAYAIVRDEPLAMKLWLDRFPDVDAARSFQYLPASMKDSMQFINDGRPITSSGSELPPWPMDSIQLKEQDALARQRASEFIARGIPNRNECDLLKAILDDIPAELEEFPFLFLYEWNPSTSIGQGDAVFANDRGGLCVVEAKAKTSKAHVTRQAKFYQKRLQVEYPDASVSSSILTNSGFDWIDERPAQVPRPLPSCACAVKEEDKSSEDTQGEEKPTGESWLLAPSRVDQLESMTVEKELKPILRHYGLMVSGRKADLVDRIYSHELSAGVAGGF